MLVELPLLLIAIALALPCAVLFCECLAALSAKSAARPKLSADLDVAVLMPAHNEADVIVKTLAALKPQLGPADRLIVIADNCTDRTAELARKCGATVLDRTDKVRRGKGYALDYGLKMLVKAPPAAVVVVDADCQFRQGSLHRLAADAIAQQRPVQAVYLIDRPLRPTLKESVSLFAFKVKNLVRPLGMARLGLPCLLTGTGMAFPWTTLAKINLGTSSIVEDMKLGLDLAIAGTPPVLCPAVTVVGPLPPNNTAAETQRTRWEHGHLQMVSRYCPRLLAEAIRQGRWDLGAIALDLSIPPLALLVLIWVAVSLGMSAIALFSGRWLPALICYGSGLALVVSVLSAWVKFAQSDISLKTLLSVPAYILWKIPVYLKFIKAPQTEWVRTNRKV